MQATYAAIPTPARPEAGPTLPPPARLPRVCFVAPTTWPLLSRATDIPVVGGAELQQAMVARELVRRGYAVSMIAHNYGQPEGCVVDGVRVHAMHAPDEGVPVVRFLHPRLTSLWSALKRANADIYYVRTAAALTGFVAQFCRRHGRRSIYSGASDVDFQPGRQDIALARDRWLYEYGLRTVDAVFAQNGNQMENVLRHYRREAALVPNCYRAPAGAAADPRGYVLWVATVRGQKRPELLLELARRMPRQRFVMVGGPRGGRANARYADDIRARAEALGNVEYRGFLPFAEADRVFDGARLVVNTSEYEGFPNTFLQAWARGIPTIAFVDTGSRQDGEPAYDVAQDMDAYHAAAERLMGDDAAWERASRRVSEHFRANHSIDAVVGLYEREFARLAGAR